jgi:tellurite resistance protein TehA-like permease
MEFSTFLTLWITCGFLAATIAAIADYLEAKDDGKEEYTVTLTHFGIGCVCIFFGIVSLIIMLIGFACTYSDKPLFKISLKKGKGEE